MKTSNTRATGARGAQTAVGHENTTRATSSGVRIIDASGRDIYPVVTLRVPWAQELEEDEAQLGAEGSHVLTNDSGGPLLVGDVVVIVGDTVQTTTTAQDTRPVGVVIIAGEDGEELVVQTTGVVDLVNVTAAVTADSYAETSTTAGAATESVTRRIGSFGVFLSSGTTPSALLFGIPDSAGTGTGGAETPVDHGNMGATETIDASVGTWHRGTLNTNCAITVTGYTADEAVVMVVKIDQDGTGGFSITWDADVLFVGDDQPNQAATSVTYYVLWSDEGDTNIYGVRVGVALDIETLTTTETDTDLRLAPDGSGGVEWSTGGGSATTRWELAVIPGSPPDSLYADGDWIYIEVPI